MSALSKLRSSGDAGGCSFRWWYFALLPSLVASVYYGLIASKQYAVEVRFAVRGIDFAAASSELLGMFTGAASSGSTLTDAYILVDYIHSKEILLRISEFMDIQKPFSGSERGYTCCVLVAWSAGRGLS